MSKWAPVQQEVCQIHSERVETKNWREKKEYKYLNLHKETDSRAFGIIVLLTTNYN